MPLRMIQDSRIHGLHYRLRSLHPLAALLFCFVAGGLLALCFAPFYYWPLAFVAMPLFYLLLESAAQRRAALARAFMFGYGFFIVGTWWIANALLVDVEKFGWMVPLSIFGLSAAMAFWFLLFGWAFWWRRSGHALADIVRFAVLWIVLEYLRAWGMFGFPWNLTGMIAIASERIAQVASLTGTFGLGFFLVIAALVPVVWLKPNMRGMERGAITVFSLLFFINAYGYGMMRMPGETLLTSTRIRVVQPNIPQEMKWTQEGRILSLNLHAQLSRMRTESVPPQIVLWSETALPFTLYPDSDWPKRISEILAPRTLLITGAVRADDRGAQLKLWNSIVAIDSEGEWRASYDKSQLVPFGEFVPLRHVLPLDKITPGDTDFSRGDGPVTLNVDSWPGFSPLICYEIIFPWLTADPTQRPEWLVNVTNDAWYGDSAGPYQHFDMSRMRAIEQGLPVARAANTGISGIIDPYGRVLRKLPFGERGIIDQALPAALPPTPYAQHGEQITLILLAGAWLLSVLLIRTRKV